MSTRYVASLTQAPYGRAITQTPALGTLWMYCVVKMDLVLACVSLAAIYAYVRYAGLSLIL